MYLDLLEKQEQKDFLELVQYAIKLDGKIDVVEKKIFESYKYECQLVDYLAYRQDSIKKVISNLRASTKKVKKIILIELFGIFIADGDFHNNESDFMSMLSQEFNIKEYEVARIYRWVEAMNDIVKEGHELISR